MVELRHTRGCAATRKAGKAEEHEIVRNIIATCSTQAERITAWQEQTRKSTRAYYRRLAEIDV